MPIANGELRILQLRMVDIFGQVQDIQPAAQLPARSLRLPNSDRIHLPPRLLQPARLNLRWLAADNAEQEWNSHPASSPICGWLVNDNVDSSILFFNQAGQALGSLDRNAKWQLAPGASSPIRPEDIENPALRAVAVQLATCPIDTYIDLIESALESIDPHSISAEESRILLFSRPVAVTRITASFELQHQPAVRQGMIDLALEARGDAPRTDRFEQVELPLRIGEHQRLGDGVVGYWRTAPGGQIQHPPVFHAPQTAWVNGRRDLNANSVHSLSLSQSFDALVLLDPRGNVHATSGIVPPKRISIPPEQYLPALARMQVTLTAAPVLTAGSNVEMPLRSEPGGEWSWIAPEQHRTVTLTARPLVARADFEKAFPANRPPGALAVWGTLLAAKVLQPTALDPALATVYLENLEKLAADAIPADVLQDLKRIFDTTGRKLSVPSGTATFAPRSLREGWLSLTPFRPAVDKN